MNFFTEITATKFWDIFLLFALPVGGGIPAGVLLAKSRGVSWLAMTLLYFISDIMLAFLFEPMMIFFVWLGQRFEILKKVGEALKKSTNKTIEGFGASPGPILLVIISFGVDPMTGRAAALAAGHGFLAGWTVAILGDMIFFAVAAYSTLTLNNILGNSMWTTFIALGVMFIIPAVIKKVRKIISLRKAKNGDSINK